MPCLEESGEFSQDAEKSLNSALYEGIGKMVASFEVVPFAQFIHSFCGCWRGDDADDGCQLNGMLSINILELQVIPLAFLHWSTQLHGLPVRVHSDNAQAMAYVN